MTVTKDLEWKDIGDELYREYIYESGFVYRIDVPLALNVSDSGGHRVYDCEGKSYYVKAGWVAIEWEGFDGELQYAF